MLIIVNRPAFSEDPTIRTSVDGHQSRFFGEAAVQIVITDPDASDSSDDSISVTIEADSRNNQSVSDSFEIPDTSPGSQRFEFFLVHAASQYADGMGEKTLDPINISGFDDPINGFDGIGASIIRFGHDSGGSELDTGDSLYEEVSFRIVFDDSEFSISYKETLGSLSLDRDSYGSDSFVYISVSDQDANLNPFEPDQFTFDPESDPNTDLFTLEGGNFGAPAVFEETGSNTAVFEARYQLSSSIVANSKSLSLTLHEKANYNQSLDAEENDSNSTDEVSFTVGNVSGTMMVIGQVRTFDPVFSADRAVYARGETAVVIITDPDANADSDKVDSIAVDVISSIDSKTLAVPESAENSGTFEVVLDLSDSGQASSIDVSDDDIVHIEYTDAYPADYLARKEQGLDPAKSFTFELKVTTPRKGVDTVTITPSIRDGNGMIIEDSYPLDGPIMVSMTLASNNDSIQPYAAIVEIRDAQDITVYLQYRTGALDPKGSADVVFSWKPDEPGKYTIRTLAISSLSDAEILSPIKTMSLLAR
jgi:hypothetical protein